MRIILNGKPTEVDDRSVFDLRRRMLPGAMITVDGYGVTEDMELRKGMSVCLFRKNSTPSEEEFDALMSARDSPDVYEKLKGARVGIAGLGGLGSNVAVLLVRAGVGHLTIADYDTVDVTNLNRQDYVLSDVGRKKTEALKERLLGINPHADIRSVDGIITKDNAASVFEGCGIVVEAFDDAEEKTMLIDTLLSETDATVVSGNGVAGYGPAGDIATTVPMERLVMCGDGATETRPGCGLTAPHVMIVSAHQANAVVRLILGLPVL